MGKAAVQQRLPAAGLRSRIGRHRSLRCCSKI